ncbi:MULTISPECIES: amino acid synthesis family protein [Rhizobium]|uniref:Amino acid synthesis family protein n=1 Tax=Rhizobium rhododendri TaxID=2506430 RepID=A0ABY8ISA9_9HYPH|nr:MULTISPECIES: amino acid synthesis family protein [Rhizobium]MBO9101168.1 amino acid synthesis family protein [Rhizobium sp. L58/93]MBO9170819.1 amino acid synthesis family protein [Rhizobium sp. L245/93]MBO9186734.1 amino acid synthesis family protein [Rhizobium sp. E27B/91]MBZ5762501.1 amino acid synthesis family protein [Rhizobium sp. VS19-DR96]MBZ5768484.1 amino acid synthesis family protein [Rhizobium sp. VS19-DR129.2]
MNLEIRRIVTFVEETLSEQGQVVQPPVRRAVAAAVVKNPYAGAFVADLSPLYDLATPLSEMLVQRTIALLGVPASAIHSFGKAAAVGEDGELEHAAAFLHPKLGAPIRAALAGGASIIPSSKKRAGPGAIFDIPLGYKDAVYVRSHFDGVEVRIPGAPKANEIVIAIALTTGGRPLPRVGGLQRADVIGKDGLR